MTTQTTRTPRALCRFAFDRTVPMDAVEDAVVLAVVAAEALHGEKRVRRDAAHFLDDSSRCCVVDARREAGETLARVLHGLLVGMFGHAAFRVETARPAARARRASRRTDASRGTGARR